MEKKSVLGIAMAVVVGIGLGEGGGPAVRRLDLVQERRRRAGEAARLAEAVARRVQADPEVVVAAVDGRGGAAVARVRARSADVVHHALHGMAPAVAAGVQGDAADVAAVL